MKLSISSSSRTTVETLLERIRQRRQGSGATWPDQPSQGPQDPQSASSNGQGSEYAWSVRKTDVLRPPAGYVYEMILDLFFNARHFVVMDGQPGPEHTHSYRVQVRCRSQALHPQNHVLVGYQELRERVKQVVKAYNGTRLNDLPVFRVLQPTTENLTGILYQQLSAVLSDLPIELVSVTVWESPTEGIVFRRVDGPSIHAN